MRRLTALGLLVCVGCGTSGAPSVGPARTDAGADADVAQALDVEVARDVAEIPPPAVRTPLGDTPVVPLGADAYRLWTQLPMVRIGDRVYMRSTYDRSGANEGGDASHFLRAERDDFNVSLDTVGPGALVFARTNHWHGSPWHYVVDGRDQVVTETSTADPDHPTEMSVFEPSALFPSPLTQTWSVTRGADLNWVPMPFEQSFVLAYGRTHYGTGYYIFRRYPDGADNLSRPLRAWNAQPPDPAALDLLRRAGEDLAPTGDAVRTRTGTLNLRANEATTLANVEDAPSVVRALRFSVPRSDALAFGRARLRITWDDRAAPSIDAPVALFFGAGTLYNRDQREWLVKGLFVNIRFVGDRVELATYHPMPFFHHARVELVSGADVRDLRWELRAEPYVGPRGWAGYFHASYRNHGEPVAGRDLVALDTRMAEGSDDWCGLFAGMSWIFSDRAELGTLEGDPRFFFDDSEGPQGYGTGTEEWGGGGDYWGGRTMTLPLAGHPVGAPYPGAARDPEDLIESAYRLLLADAMPFGRNARIQLEHGAENDIAEHYQTVVYWYGRPGACLVPSDALHVGDVESEQAHGYRSPMASEVETITSRYELGVDHLGGREVIAATTDTGRHTTGTSAFTLRLDPHNLGVLLRRKLDYQWPDQRAEVYVSDDRDGAPRGRAGTWYTAGSNRCVYSNPAAETGAPMRAIQTSNRRFRDDEFLIPRALTEGRSAVRIELRFVPRPTPIAPGESARPQAWSELRYTAFSYVLPP